MNIKRKKKKKKKKRREPGTGRRAGKVERRRGIQCDRLFGQKFQRGR